MTGRQIKDVLEDVCDNLFNADPYYQQGGDMVRVGGLSYTCAPAEAGGKRISELEARQRSRAGSRQELQGRRVGLGQRAERRAGLGRGRKTSAVAASRPTGQPPGVDAEGRRGQSGHREVRDERSFDHHSRRRSAALLDRCRAHRRSRAAGAAAGQAVRRAQDRAAALRQRPAQAGPRAQRRQQSDEVLRSGQGRASRSWRSVQGSSC